MQEYFLVSATVQDIVRRFQRSRLPWNEFPSKNAIQLNDTHSTLAIPELLRLLVDEHGVGLAEGIEIVKNTFSFTCQNVLNQAMEEYEEKLLGDILPRHLELIYEINQSFLEDVWKKHPYNCDRQKLMSCISDSEPRKIRITHLAIVGSHYVNGVSALHTTVLKGKLEYFDDFFTNKINNVTNGISTRRWINLANPPLSKLITDYSKSQKWLDDWNSVENLKEEVTKNAELESTIYKDLEHVKSLAKIKLVNWLRQHCNLEVSEEFMFDIQLKNFSEGDRQLMNLLYCVDRYLSLRSMSPEDRVNAVKRITFFGGKADMENDLAKSIIKLINQIASYINEDVDTNQFFKIAFIPNYRTSMAEVVIPASDVFESLSSPVTESGNTVNMMAAMNGALLIASREGTNIEIAEQIGESNLFFFGSHPAEANFIRHKNIYAKLDGRLKLVLEHILSGNFGNLDSQITCKLTNNLLRGDDYFLVPHDYKDYSRVQESVDKSYKDKPLWYKMVINSLFGMGRFTSDRVVNEYATKIWKLDPFMIPEPSTDPENKQIIYAAQISDKI